MVDLRPTTEHALIRFMKARLAERQQRAETALEAVSGGRVDCWTVVAQQLTACCDTLPRGDRAYQVIAFDGDPDQVLRDVAAIRRIVEDYRITAGACRRNPSDILYAKRDTLASCVRTLAAAWKDHSEYAEAVRHGLS